MSTEEARMEAPSAFEPSPSAATETTTTNAEQTTGTPETTPPTVEQSTGGAEYMPPQAEQTTSGTKSASTGSTGSAKAPDVNLGEELRVFGKQIETLFTAARQSAKGKEIEQQLTSAWRDVERGINITINTASSSDFKGTLTGTAQYAADEVQIGMARGLRNLNQWMEQKSREMEERRQAREAAAAAAPTPTTIHDDDITDRFSGDEPVFGQDLHVPAAPVTVTSEPDSLNRDNDIADRFDDKPNPTPFGEVGQSN